MPRNFSHALFDTAQARPERTALVTPEGDCTYAELAERAGGIARGLTAEGIRPGGGIAPGERVAIFLPRGIDAAAAFFGTLASGGVAVIVNESLKPRQIEHILDHSGAAVLLTTPDMTERLPRPLETRARPMALATLGGGDLDPVGRIGTDVAQIIYTSGSTGLPKGVTLSHGNLWAGMRSVTTYLRITEEDRIASLLPFSFDYGLNQLFCAVGTGAALVVERSPIPQRIVHTLCEQQVTVLPTVPPSWFQLLGVASFEQEPIPSLRLMTNTGGLLPAEAVRRLRRAQPQAELVLMYGLTEAFRSAYLDPSKVDRKPGSVGGAIPGAELLVVREDGTPCEPGEVGELVHRGPTVALGYWDDPELTARIYRPNPCRPAGAPDSERVVFSGDFVRRDEEGDLFFVSRRDKMIKTLGYRVSPDEVVEVLYASGEAIEALVTSEPDEDKGNRIVAYVVLSPDGDLDRLTGFCATELPRYMQPARIEVRSELERTHSGKYDVAATAARDAS